jgi:adenine-specific DNA-methyltransferase
VAVAIGPQYGTVGPDDVKEAAKEAVQGVSYDLLVCAASPSTRTCPRK